MSEGAGTRTVSIEARKVVVFEGPNIFSPKPVIGVELSATALEANRLQAVEERLHSALADAAKEVGGTVWENATKRSEAPSTEAAASSLADLVARTAVQMQRLLGHEVDFWTSRDAGGLDGETAVLEFRDSSVGRLAIPTLVGVLNALLGHGAQERGPGAPSSEREQFVAYLRGCARFDLGHICEAIIAEAERRDIPWIRLFSDRDIIQLGQGRKQQRFLRSITKNTSYIAGQIAGSKSLASRFFRSHGIPAPVNLAASDEEKAVAAAHRIGFPVVVKPNGTEYGTAVSVQLSDEVSVRRAYRLAKRYGPVVVERQIPGINHRFLVVNGKTLSVVRQKPAQVLGDGRQSIAQLIERENRGRTDTLTHQFKKIKIDEQALQVLSGQGYGLDDVPPAGAEVFLRLHSNLSVGGSNENVTHLVHPENRAMVERAVRLIGLDIAGVDLVTTDVTRPYHETGAEVCEINSMPAWVMGAGRDIAGFVMDAYFAPGEDGRIPTAAVMGPLATALTVDILSAILSQAGYLSGLATEREVQIGGVRVAVGDFSGVQGCRYVLRDPIVDVAVLETSYKNAIAQGLGFDRCSVAAVLDSSAAAAGPDKAGSVEDVMRAKELLVSTAGNCVVVNADDPHFDRLRRWADARPFHVVAPDPSHPNAVAHFAEGGSGLALEARGASHWITQWQAGQSVRLISSEFMPLSRSGGSDAALAAACFASAIAIGLGCDPTVVCDTLSRFSP